MDRGKVFVTQRRNARNSAAAVEDVRRRALALDGEIRVRGDPAHLARRVRDHLIGVARQEMTRRARLLAERIGRQITRVTVRDTTSRWGSCSATGCLSFRL